MASAEISLGNTLAGFRLEALAHKGGMATLWSVTHPEHPGPMLMKLPRMGEGADPAAIVSFEMEQMILPTLSGPHVPTCIASGWAGSQPYLVMEQVPGPTLLKRLPDLPLPVDEVVGIGARVATALQNIHEQHVVHHDVKPSNIAFRPSGEAVMLDYGLAFHERLPDLLQEEFRLPFGTAPYMAPERLRGWRKDPRSDLFSLGVLLYFFATGTRPFGEGERLSSMRQRLWRDPHPPRHLRPDMPAWLQEIILHCLEVEPARRYATAAQLAFELSHPGDVKLTRRAERLKRDSLGVVLHRRFAADDSPPRQASVSAQLATAPIVLVAIDLEGATKEVDDELLASTKRLLTTMPQARVALLNVLKRSRIALDQTLDAEGRNRHVQLLAQLRNWAEPLRLDPAAQLTVHVVEATNPAQAILDFAEAGAVAHILMGARQTSLRKSLLGSVSAEVAASARCTVTVVRPLTYREP